MISKDDEDDITRVVRPSAVIPEILAAAGKQAAPEAPGAGITELDFDITGEAARSGTAVDFDIFGADATATDTPKAVGMETVVDFDIFGADSAPEPVRVAPVPTAEAPPPQASPAPAAPPIAASAPSPFSPMLIIVAVVVVAAIVAWFILR